jgi:hypothetical protein
MQNVLVVWVDEGPAPRWGAGVWGREFRGCRYAAIPVYQPAPLRGEYRADPKTDQWHKAGHCHLPQVVNALIQDMRNPPPDIAVKGNVTSP